MQTISVLTGFKLLLNSQLCGQRPSTLQQLISQRDMDVETIEQEHEEEVKALRQEKHALQQKLQEAEVRWNHLITEQRSQVSVTLLFIFNIAFIYCTTTQKKPFSWLQSLNLKKFSSLKFLILYSNCIIRHLVLVNVVSSFC